MFKNQITYVLFISFTNPGQHNTEGQKLGCLGPRADAALLTLLWPCLCLPCPQSTPGPGAASWTRGHSPGDMPMPSGLCHTYTESRGVGVWDIHNTSKYNAVTLLRHESVVFKHFSSFLKKNIYLFLFSCTEPLLWHVGSSSLTWDRTWASLFYISS